MHSLTKITDYLLIQSLQVTALVIVVWIVSLFLKNKSAHVRYLLWLLVPACCLVPPLYTIHLPVLPARPTHSVALPEPQQLVDRRFPDRAVIKAPASALAPTLHDFPTGQVKVLEIPAEPARVQFNIGQWLALAWVAGVIVFASAAITKALLTRRKLLKSRKYLPPGLADRLNALAAEFGLRNCPGLWLVEGFSQPFVWGLLRGQIYLPQGFLREKQNYIRQLLAHEFAHVIRWDPAVNLLQILAQILYWFHPFLWWANKKIRSEREKCCDETAIAQLGAVPAEYGRAIVQTLVAERRGGFSVPSLAVAGPVKNIEDRIKTIMKADKKFYRRPGVQTIAIVALLAPTTLALSARKGKDELREYVEKYLYQKSDSIENALRFIDAPEERMSQYKELVRGQGELISGQLLRFANKVFALRKSKDVNDFISLLSKEARKRYEQGDETSSVFIDIWHIKRGRFIYGEYDFKFFAVVRKFTDEDWDEYGENFRHRPDYWLVFCHFHKPKYFLCGTSFYVKKENGSYKLVDQIIAPGSLTELAKEKTEKPVFGIAEFKQNDDAYKDNVAFKYEWHIRLDAQTVDGNDFRVVKVTRRLAGDTATQLPPQLRLQVLVEPENLEKIKYKGLDFRILIGQSAPYFPYSKDGYRLMGWTYGFYGPGYFSSALFVPGKNITDEKPRKTGGFVGDELELISFRTTQGDTVYEHKIVVEKKPTGESTWPSDRREEFLLPGSRTSVAEAISNPQFGFAAVCKALDSHPPLCGEAGVYEGRQKFKVVEVLSGKGPASGKEIDIWYRYFHHPGLRERPIKKGERVIWIVCSGESQAYFGIKALADTQQNRDAVKKAVKAHRPGMHLAIQASLENLRRLYKAFRRYAEDNAGRGCEEMEQLHPYLDPELLGWVLKNVTYVNVLDLASEQVEIVSAYDHSFLKAGLEFATVLFRDGTVAVRDSAQLRELGIEPSYFTTAPIPQEALAVMSGFRQALAESRWDKALSLCSERVRERARSYDSVEQFFRAVVPVAAVVQKSKILRHYGKSYYPNKVGGGLYFAVQEQADEPVEKLWWQVSVRKKDSKWFIHFDTTPIKRQLERMRAGRLRAEARRRERQAKRAAARARLKDVRVRTILTAAGKTFVLGEPMLFRLELVNEGTVTVFYDHQQVAVNGSMIIRDQRGHRVPYIAGPYQTSGEFRPLKPRESVVLFDNFDITSQYYIDAPGRYSIQFNGEGLMIGLGPEDGLEPLISVGFVPSNVVEIEVVTK